MIVTRPSPATSNSPISETTIVKAVFPPTMPTPTATDSGFFKPSAKGVTTGMSNAAAERTAPMTMKETTTRKMEDGIGCGLIVWQVAGIGQVDDKRLGEAVP